MVQRKWRTVELDRRDGPAGAAAAAAAHARPAWRRCRRAQQLAHPRRARAARARNSRDRKTAARLQEYNQQKSHPRTGGPDPNRRARAHARRRRQYRRRRWPAMRSEDAQPATRRPFLRGCWRRTHAARPHTSTMGQPDGAQFDHSPLPAGGPGPAPKAARRLPRACAGAIEARAPARGSPAERIAATACRGRWMINCADRQSFGPAVRRWPRSISSRSATLGLRAGENRLAAVGAVGRRGRLWRSARPRASWLTPSGHTAAHRTMPRPRAAFSRQTSCRPLLDAPLGRRSGPSTSTGPPPRSPRCQAQ